MKSIYIFIFLLLASFGLQAQDTEPTRQERMERMESLKVAYITRELDLTPQESAAFWSVFNQHEKNIKQLKKSNRLLKKGFSVEELTEAEAKDLITSILSQEEEQMQLKKQLISDLEPIIGYKRMLKLKKADVEFKRKLLGDIGKKERKKQKRKYN